jgi:hypothetical protein
MTPVNARPPEIALPVACLGALRAALAGDLGADRAAQALRAAGGAAGHTLFRTLSHPPGSDLNGADETSAREWLAELEAERFWDRFAKFFSSRGWGRLSFRSLHEGVGALDASDWVEADPGGGMGRPSCFFTTGMLAGVLGRVTDEEVAVLEVECRSQGHTRCRFLFGAPPALEAVFHELAAGRDLETTLAALR